MEPPTNLILPLRARGAPAYHTMLGEILAAAELTRTQHLHSQEQPLTRRRHSQYKTFRQQKRRLLAMPRAWLLLRK